MDAVTLALVTKRLATKASLVDGKVPADELPSYVDDAVEYEDADHFPEEGEAGKIYIALDTGYTYRWSGSTYVQIGGQDLSNYYTKEEEAELLSGKQDALPPTDSDDEGKVLAVGPNGELLFDETPVFNTPYNKNTNKAATMADITAAITNALNTDY